LCEGTPLPAIPGMRTASVRGSVTGTSPMPVAAEMIGTPDFRLLDLSVYPNPTPVLPVAMSRDCDWGRCRFCAHNFSFHGYRQKDACVFVDEIETLMARHGATHFYLADQYVSAPALERLSDEILRRGLPVNFHLMARPTQDHTPARLAKAAAAGCRWISWGIETGSQRLLNLVRKGTRREVIERLMHDSHQAGIVNLMMMIFGLPTSTDEDLDQTFDLIEQVYPWIDAIKSSSFVLFDGTPFARDARRFGMVITGRQEMLRIAGKPVHSSRLNFMSRASDGTLVPPCGPIEVSRWMQRRRWLGELSFAETLCCEHFLLYSSHAKAGNEDRPVRPLPRRAA
jgi:anaerobic magnesium-protoporphyrin IX monomethyl ester cyclase